MRDDKMRIRWHSGVSILGVALIFCSLTTQIDGLPAATVHLREPSLANSLVTPATMIGHNAPVCVDEFISQNEAKIRSHAENASKLSLLIKVARLAKSNLKKIQCPFGSGQQGTFISPHVFLTAAHIFHAAKWENEKIISIGKLNEIDGCFIEQGGEKIHFDLANTALGNPPR